MLSCDDQWFIAPFPIAQFPIRDTANSEREVFPSGCWTWNVPIVYTDHEPEAYLQGSSEGFTPLFHLNQQPVIIWVPGCRYQKPRTVVSLFCFLQILVS